MSQRAKAIIGAINTKQESAKLLKAALLSKNYWLKLQS